MRVALLIAALLLIHQSASAQATQASITGFEPMRGFGWDLNIDGGIGFGLRRTLDDNFLGRARLGALYFSEPMIYALGITGELGGLARYGVGVAFEASHFNGPWARLSGARVDGGAWMSQLTLGYLFFGLEWQHRFETATNNTDALIFVFRLPVGTWWFLMRQQQVTRPPLPAMPATPDEDPGAARASRAASNVDPGDRLLAARLIEEATLAEHEERWRDAEELLSRAERLDPSPLLTLRLARAQRKAEHIVSAADSLQRFIAAAVTPEEIDARTAAEQERLEALALMAYLRLRIEPLADNETVWLDGRAFSVAALGYPYPIDPGRHVIEVKRGDSVILRREIEVAVGASINLKWDPNATATDDVE